MTRHGAQAPLDSVRAFIAHQLLPGAERVPATLGAVTLRDQQRRCADRLLSALEENGGVLLADPVGVGKTFVALAVAGYFPSVLVLAPAALRDMWRQALEQTQTIADIISHEALSAGHLPNVRAALVIVDEAHRLRSVDARRYAAAAELCRGAGVLLVTATPIQNRTADLRAQIALFLGTEAWTCDEDHLASHVVRDPEAFDAPALPVLDGPHLVPLPQDEDLLDELLTLPPAIPPADGGMAHALAQFGLVHQWASSRAALRAALERRRARGLALLAALESGRHPTRAELTTWHADDGALQLAFPELVAASPSDGASDVASLIPALSLHLERLNELALRLRTSLDIDAARAIALSDIRHRHPGERIIAFSQYAETVTSLYRRLAAAGGVAMLTARGARIASGRIPRAEILRQFAAIERAGPGNASAIDRVGLLLTTDLLSEGLNLQRASVIVHLDMPWNPARLDQRVGRARRLGSPHACVTVYSFAPPAEPNRLLAIEQRLRAKLTHAHRAVGIAGHILPRALMSVETARPPIAEQRSTLREVVQAWSRQGPNARMPDPGTIPLAAVAGAASGFLALVRVQGRPVLVADLGDGARTDSDTVLHATKLAGGRETLPPPAAVCAAQRSVADWLERLRGRATIDLSAAAAARARRAALERVARTLARTPRQRLPLVAPLARAVRAVATAPMGAGAERILATLVGAELPDEAWLRAVAAFGDVNARERTAATHEDDILALVILCPE